jgi:capsid portal protein
METILTQEPIYNAMIYVACILFVTLICGVFAWAVMYRKDAVNNEDDYNTFAERMNEINRLNNINKLNKIKGERPWKN